MEFYTNLIKENYRAIVVGDIASEMSDSRLNKIFRHLKLYGRIRIQ